MHHLAFAMADDSCHDRLIRLQIDKLTENQQRCLELIRKKDDAFIVLPTTGSGKSICYQLAPFTIKGLLIHSNNAYMQNVAQKCSYHHDCGYNKRPFFGSNNNFFVKKK